MESNLQSIADNYKKFDVYDLIEMSKEPQKLRPEVIPLLIAELKQRNKHEIAESLENYTSNNNSAYLSSLSKQELKNLIKAKIDRGEPIDGVKLFLKDNGIDFFKIIESEKVETDKIYNHLASLKNENLNSDAIEVEMQSKYNFTADETSHINDKLKAKGKTNITIGIVFLILGLLILGFSLFVERVIVGAFAIIAIGIERIIKGKTQKK